MGRLFILVLALLGLNRLYAQEGGSTDSERRVENQALYDNHWLLNRIPEEERNYDVRTKFLEREIYFADSYFRRDLDEEAEKDDQDKIRNEYLRLINQVQTSNSTESTSDHWNQLGPFYPYTGSSRNGYAIGIITAIWVDPGDQNHLMIGTGNSGLWESSDAGDSWECLTTLVQSFGIYAISVHPSNHDEIVIATGIRAGGYHKWQHYSLGILKSTDGGASWTNTTPTIWDYTNVYLMERDPNDENNLLAYYDLGSDITNPGSQLGGYVIKSTDGGDSWNWKTTFSNNQVEGLKYSKTTNDLVYLTGENLYQVSTDGGETWSDEFGDLDIDSKIDWVLTCDLVEYDNDEYFYIYAHRANYNQTYYNLFLRKVNSDPFDVIEGQSINVSGGIGYSGSEFVKISPDNPNRLYYGKTYAVTGELDANLDWISSSKSSYASQMHDDMRAFFALDADNLYAGTDGGIMISNDAGDTWSYAMGDPGNHFENKLGITQFYEFDVYNDEGEVLIVAGCQDNGTIFFQNGTWQHAAGGDGGMSKFLAEDNDYIYFTVDINSWLYTKQLTKSSGHIGSSSYFGDASHLYSRGIEKDIFGNNALFSLEHGSCTFKNHLYYLPDVPSNRGSVPANAVELHGGISICSVQYAGTTTGIAQCRADEDVMAHAITSWVTNGFNLYLTTDGGTNWTDVSSSILSQIPEIDEDYQHITKVVYHPLNPDIIWVSFSHFVEEAKVIQTTDGGLNWTNLSSSSYNIFDGYNFPCNDLAYDLEHDILYAASEIGVFYLDLNDPNQTWERLWDNLPFVKVTEMKIMNDFGKLYVATYGRGIWEAPLYCSNSNWSDDPLVGTIPSENYFDANTLSSTGLVPSTNDVHMYSSSAVLLEYDPTTQNGFTVHKEGYFLAKILECPEIEGFGAGESSLRRSEDIRYDERVSIEPPIDIDVFPNPANGFFNVRICCDSDIQTSELFDFNGRKVDMTLINSNSGKESEYMYKVNNFDPGIYLLRVSHENGQYSQKLLIR